jgi:hypothetical protein
LNDLIMIGLTVLRTRVDSGTLERRHEVPERFGVAIDELLIKTLSLKKIDAVMID